MLWCQLWAAGGDSSGWDCISAADDPSVSQSVFTNTEKALAAAVSRCRPDHILTSGLGLLAEARGGGANHSAASSGLQCGEVTVLYPVGGDTWYVYSHIRVLNCYV